MPLAQANDATKAVHTDTFIARVSPARL